ncbi:MAG TPA: threonine-phosphate decarboxylase CobD [Candidatus Cybelea sp.]|nr:threonine-phosphate decarboxylase CobD [Candidatus Cybelea sp.]
MPPFDHPPPVSPAPVYHGGDLGWAMAQFPDAPKPWLDLSTGINPWPYALPPLAPNAWARLPSEAMLRRLCTAAARYYGAGDPNCVVAAPGSQALIQWLPRLRKTSQVAVLGPTYGEHAPCWIAAGHDVDVCARLDDIAAGVNVVVLGNPNNPDGRIFAANTLIALADRMASRGGWIVVDEAFADTAPALSIVRRATDPGCVVLRSFGKFFGLAGLRLGFLLAAPALAGEVRAALGPWAVSGPAAEIGARALSDAAWIEATRSRIGAAARKLEASLAQSGAKIVGGTGLFCLIEHRAAPRVFEALCRSGIFVRRFAERPDWLRIGLPPDDAALIRLQEALGA